MRVDAYEIVVLHPRLVDTSQPTMLNAVVTFAGWNKIYADPGGFARRFIFMRQFVQQKLQPAIDGTDFIITGYVSYGRSGFEVMHDASIFAAELESHLKLRACTIFFTPVKVQARQAA